MFEPLPAVPDHNRLELDILDYWEAANTFSQLREKNRGGPKFSFIDGPVTANKSLAVHTAWGRTLKDVFQRYKAARGFDQRYQNGFDCQGLWIEVGVERELGLNSKREIEEFGLEAFARECRAVVKQSAEDLTAGSIRLGQWMDWGRDYFTFADTNIEYIWKFLKLIDDKGWLYQGQRATEWCPRCGTSISAHELSGSYVERADQSVTVRFPLLDRPDESLVIWTTTPWTLPANVAVAVNPELRYGHNGQGEWRAVSDSETAPDPVEVRRGSELIGWTYGAPYDDFDQNAAAATSHRVIPWDMVAADEGTGLVHIAPGCGTEDFDLGEEHGLQRVMPVDESGVYYEGFGWLAGLQVQAATPRIVTDLQERGFLVETAQTIHRAAECWRCHTPLIFRISDDWFISLDDLRQPMIDANATIEWTPDYMGKRMGDWLQNMGDWNISRRRYYGLPLPFYPCRCGETTVVGSRAELCDRAVGEIENLEELRRPWIDDVQIACPACGAPVERIAEVGDVWLDAGIVPFSTLGWENDQWVDEGYGTGAAAGLTTADLPDNSYWQQWFPADWVSEMREQIRLWFYSQLLMSVALTGKAPYRKVLGYEKMLDEAGREMHGSWGNQIDAPDAFAEMGADVMRWQFCQQPPSQDLLFGFSSAREIQGKLITLWNCAAFLVQYANAANFQPRFDAVDHRATMAQDANMLDRWLDARTDLLVHEATEAYESFLTTRVIDAFESYLDDLSKFYVRRSRRRFWNDDRDAITTLWRSLARALKVLSPIMPFLTEHLWRRLVAVTDDPAPESVFFADWPSTDRPDSDILEEVGEMRVVIDLGRRARDSAGLPFRQPLSLLVVDGIELTDQMLSEVRDELRVKEVVCDSVEASEVAIRPNLKRLGPVLGAALPEIRAALDRGEFELHEDGSVSVGGRRLTAEDVLVDQKPVDGWALASNDDSSVTVSLRLALDDDLRLEARVYELIHRVNGRRKDLGFELTDRIRLSLTSSDADLTARYREWIMTETLAVELVVQDDLEELLIERS